MIKILIFAVCHFDNLTNKMQLISSKSISLICELHWKRLPNNFLFVKKPHHDSIKNDTTSINVVLYFSGGRNDK